MMYWPTFVDYDINGNRTFFVNQSQSVVMQLDTNYVLSTVAGRKNNKVNFF